MTIRAYRHQLVRDLRWLISGPPLFRDGLPGIPMPPAPWLAQLADEAEPWLADIDRRPEELEAWMQRHQSRRLGHHAEALVAFWLKRHPGITLHGARIVVADAGTTRGDLDLLFSCDRRKARVHWEMAVKFYLGDPPQEAWDNWIAPDPRDRLADKLQRIATHQLPLGRHPIANQGASRPTWSEAFIKGWLFYPADRDWRTITASPAQAHPHHPRGWWLRHGAADIPRESRTSRFLLLPRNEWLSPARRQRSGHAGVLSGTELVRCLEQHFRQHQHAVIIAEVQSDLEGWWAECARGTVVHPDWPLHHRPDLQDGEG
jgi:hypothetical protein